MSIRQFVCGSSILLAAWLGATFLKEVPVDRYPKLGKPALSASASRPMASPAVRQEIELTVSTGR